VWANRAELAYLEKQQCGDGDGDGACFILTSQKKERARKVAGYGRRRAQVLLNRIKLLTMPQNKRKNIA